MTSRTSKTLVALALAAGLVLVAFVSISLAVSGSATDGHSAQAPLGTLSANDGERIAGQQQSPGGGQSGGELTTAGQTGGQPGSLPSTGSASEGGGGSGKLPFTGLVAIPILLVGVAMLATGLLLRRRRPTDATA
jgi:hypothetical protein